MKPTARRSVSCTVNHPQLSQTVGIFAAIAAAYACSSSAPAAPATAPTSSGVAASEPTTASAEPKHAGAPPSAPSAATAGAPDAGAPDASAQPPDAAPKQPLELPQGSTVLHIGDSFAGALGVPLNAELRQAGLVSHLRFKTASFIPNWAGGYDLGAYIAQLKPDLVLITLGANEMAMKDPTLRVPLIKKIVKRLNGTPCVWIATPLWGMDNGLMDLIRDNSAPCRFMDTNKLHPGMPRLSDKIHPTIAARQGWAKVVIDWLRAEREPTAAQVWHLKGVEVPGSD